MHWRWQNWIAPHWIDADLQRALTGENRMAQSGQRAAATNLTMRAWRRLTDRSPSFGQLSRYASKSVIRSQRTSQAVSVRPEVSKGKWRRAVVVRYAQRTRPELVEGSHERSSVPVTQL